MRRKKLLACWMAAVMAAGLFAGCGEEKKETAEGQTTGKAADGTLSEEETEETQEEITLKVSLWDYSNTDYYKTLFEKYMEENPYVTIEAIELTAGEYDDLIGTRLAGKADYDVVFTKSTAALSGLIDQGFLVPLDDYIHSEESFQEDHYSGLLEQLKWEGDQKTYALPFRKDNNMIFYNKDMFDKAGVEYPHDGMTMEEYRELAKTMTTGEGAEKVYGSYVHKWTDHVTLYPTRTGEWTPYDGNDMTALKPYYQTILAMQNEDQSVMTFGAIQAGQIALNATFYSEQTAMEVNGTWFINNLCVEEGNGQVNFHWDVCSLPSMTGEGNDKAVGGITPAGIGKYSSNPDEAWKLLKFLCGEEAALVLASQGIVPAYTSEEVFGIFDALPEKYQYVPENLSKYIDLEEYVISQPLNVNGKAISKAIDQVHTEIMARESVTEEELDAYLAQMAEWARAAGAGQS